MTAGLDKSDTNASMFDGFATFIDDDNVPGFESLNKSTFFDQVMNASKLFDQDIPTSKLNESLAKLNESFSYQTVMKYNNRDISSMADELCFSVEEEDDEDDEDNDEFEEELLFAYLQKKMEQKQKEQSKSGRVGEDGESVSTATVSLSSHESSTQPAIEESSERPLIDEPSDHEEEKEEDTATKKVDDMSEKDKEEPEKKTDHPPSNAETPKSKRSVRKPARQSRPEKESELKLKVVQKDRHSARQHHRRASVESNTTPPKEEAKQASERSSIRSERSSVRAEKRSSIRAERSSIRSERSSVRRPTSPKENSGTIVSPQSQRRSTIKSGDMTSPESSRSNKATTRRGAKRQSLGHDILKRNFQILDKQNQLERAKPLIKPAGSSSDRRKKHEAWKSRKSQTCAGPSAATQEKRKSVLELANQVSSIQAAAAAAVAKAAKPPSLAKVTTAKISVSVYVDAALSRISQVGLKAKDSIIKIPPSCEETVASKDDASVVSVLRQASPATPHRRMRRRVSCV